MSTVETSLSTQIYSSREEIRNQLIAEAEQYLQLENIQTNKATFLSYVINVLSILTGNLFFYNSSTYKEFFLTKAQLPESIYELAAYLGYDPTSAQYASVNVLMSIPLSFSTDVQITIPSEHSFYAGDIEFQTYYSTKITIVNNTDITIVITDSEAGRIYEQNYTINDSTLYFLLALRQYESDIQTFQIPDDLGQYIFYTVDVNFDGQASSLSVQVKERGETSYELYTYYSSLYLIPSGTKGYTYRNISGGKRIYFGNGFIGSQPGPGSEVLVTTLITEGTLGNVIENSINRGNRIYTSTGEIVNYSVTNAPPARYGSDEETLQDIKSNAIANVIAQERITSELDHNNLESIISGVPLESPYPILKRSDLTANHVNIYTVLMDGTSVIPARTDTIDISLDSTAIPQYTEVSVDSSNYYTLFGLELNRLNSSATYDYSIKNLTVSLSRSRLYGIDYDMFSNYMTIVRDSTGEGLTFTIPYTTDESDYGLASCQVLLDGVIYDTANDSTSQQFIFYVDDYQTISKGLQRIYITFSDPSGSATVEYVGEVYIRRDLDLFMLSNISDGTDYTHIYDVPIISKTYYDNLTFTQLNDFETNVLQQLLTSFTVSNYVMLSEFLNLKFSNTTGPMKSMLYNTITKSAVIDLVSTLPGSPSSGDRYIIDNASSLYNGYIAEYNGIAWSYTRPNGDDIVYITNKESKYIYTEFGWIVPQFTNPLEIEIEVFKEDTYVGTDEALRQAISTALISDTSSSFGTSIKLSRSVLIRTIQNVSGVDRCRLLKPKSNVFTTFDLDDLTRNELIEYSPDYVYFTEDDITIRIVS